MTAWDAPADTNAPVQLGDCFRCDRGGVQVIRVGELVGPYGETPLYACRCCVERLVAMGHHTQETPVRPYVGASTW
ncbi:MULTISPECIES: hypothetical protein [Streptomyces]|uniref:Uncharacterized protein n=1 Tax=Streptomyces corynorhini TaxID=2282652 RepID=A0A370BA78_9ACTN|nr:MULTISPECIES: hypothetical protein [Streptomyces]RDG38697.1 hypothetical protein DVH02_07870 [Streptomyces corynorhini]